MTVPWLLRAPARLGAVWRSERFFPVRAVLVTPLIIVYVLGGFLAVVLGAGK